jgi:integration host factor subunit alpha
VVRNNLTKKELIKNLSINKGYSNLLSKKLINDLIKIIIKIIKEKELNIKNIGTFKVVEKKERLGRNPKTKINFKITARKIIRFIASKKLIESVNK